MKSFLKRWLINTLAVLVATYAIPGIRYESPLDLFGAALVLGILNAIVRPLLLFLSLPLLVFTLGLFMFVINAFLLLLVSRILGESHFHVTGFGAAFFGGLVISLVSLILNSLTRSGDSRISVKRGKTSPRDDDSGGPVIDV
ncbi:MAG: phage holin family protein [Verrucomicrobiota bacterium]